MHAPHAVRHQDTVHCPSCSSCRVAVLRSEITVPLLYGVRRTVIDDHGRIEQVDLALGPRNAAQRTSFEELSCLRCGFRFGLRVTHDPATAVARLHWVLCEAR